MHLLFIISGVMSSLGKGITTAALGALLKVRGFSVWLIKLDPYLNVRDFKTYASMEKLFVTLQGRETDLRHYECFTVNNNSGCCLAGSIYQDLISKELHGKWQMANFTYYSPRDAIKQKILICPEETDFILCKTKRNSMRY